MGAKTNTGGRRSAGVSVIRGILIAAATSVVLVLLFACAVLLFDLGAEVITPVNQVLKVASVLAGTLAAAQGGDSPLVRRTDRRRRIHGAGDRTLLCPLKEHCCRFP